MKKLLFLFCLMLLLTSCGNPDSNDDTDTKTIISTLNYTNKGKMGDTDGPAFAVYSNIGYTGASATLDIANMEINTVMPNGKFVNGYAFFGIDVYNKTGSWWENCVDVGLCWSGKNGGIKDEVRVEVKGAYADGRNTAFLFNTALDYPPNTKLDREGKSCNDFVEITLANTDQGLYLRSFRVEALTLYQGDTTFHWANDKSSAVSIWPDKSIAEFDYAPTIVETSDGTEYVIDLDMNR